MTDPTLPDSPYKRILFCTDFSANADHAFDLALDAVRRRPGSTLHLLHVIPEPDASFWRTYIYEVEGVDAKARADIDAKIAATYTPRIPPTVEVQVDIRIGKDYLEILQFAAERAIDLIVLGRQGHSSVSELFFGGVTEKVVRKAHCPVLVVPLPARSDAATPR